MAKLVVSHVDFARVWYQVSYCMDVSNIARNALAMPLPPPSTDADTEGGGEAATKSAAGASAEHVAEQGGGGGGLAAVDRSWRDKVSRVERSGGTEK